MVTRAPWSKSMQLVPREEIVKVTLSLSRRSGDFFKRAAKA
jgi:hypothetical protein